MTLAGDAAPGHTGEAAAELTLKPPAVKTLIA
jgi:hypothetical protein